jgi:prepilin-type N-terminal cleavage/methylation domain-containing protein
MVDPHGHPAHGFTLIETLVALVLVSLTLLLGLSLLWQQPRILERLARQEEAYREIEVVLEAVRARSLPLALGTTPLPAIGESLTLDVEETPTPDFYRVTVTARYRVQGRDFERSVTTGAWRP